MSEKPDPGTHPQPLYAVTMHNAITSGDLNRMKQVAQQAEQYLQQSGDLPAALQALKIEIAKAEHKK
jgi:Domain of unknown function (DUF1843)